MKMISEKRWMIVNLLCLDGLPGTIPIQHRPKWVHASKELAEDELLRLQQNNPHDDFVLFEAVATTRKVDDVWFVEPIDAKEVLQ